MTDIGKRALELVNAVGVYHHPSLGAVSLSDLRKALVAALEAHEADKARHAAEMREQAERFSEAVTAWIDRNRHTPGATELFKLHFAPFILAPVDPLEKLKDWAGRHSDVTPLDGTDRDSPTFGELRQLLAIVKKEAVNG